MPLETSLVNCVAYHNKSNTVNRKAHDPFLQLTESIFSSSGTQNWLFSNGLGCGRSFKWKSSIIVWKKWTPCKERYRAIITTKLSLITNQKKMCNIVFAGCPQVHKRAFLSLHEKWTVFVSLPRPIRNEQEGLKLPTWDYININLQRAFQPALFSNFCVLDGTS